MGKVLYNEQELIKKLNQLSKELGHTPTELDVAINENLPSVSYYCKIFGSFNQALIAAGLKPNKIINQPRAKKEPKKPRTSRFKKDKLIELLKMKADELGRTPTYAEVSLDKRFPSAATYSVMFGTYNQAVEAAGLRPNEYHERNKNQRALRLNHKKAP